MASSNAYAKTYVNRRSATEVELYKLILFPADNSIAVVKSKQCSPAEQDGFLYVQTGRKKFTGVVLEEGDLGQCSQAADRLTKKQVNPEIESDYERGPDENQSTQVTARTSTLTTLTDVPFGNYSSNVQPFTPFTSPPTRSNYQSNTVNCDVGLVDESCQRMTDRINNPTARSPSLVVPLVDVSSTLGNSDRSSKRYQTHATVSKNKRRKHSGKEKVALTSFDDDVDEADSSNDGEEESRLTEKRSSTSVTPSFVGHRVTASPTHSTPRSTVSSMTQQLLAATLKLESQYLRPLLVAQERTEAMTKCLIINQKKIQRALRKQKVNISLVSLDETSETVDDQAFSTSLEYTSSEGITVDLLKCSGVKEHANRYVTSVMDLLYKPEDLLAIQTADVPKEERYLLLKEAVRNKFRLAQDELETMWIWLHTVFLAKRRTFGAKKRQQRVSGITG